MELFPNTYTISSQDGTVQERCDCMVSYTHNSKCVIYLTVGDRCRVFPLHRIYKLVHIDNLVLDIRLDRFCLVNA